MSAKVLELFKSMFNILASIFTIENVKVVFDKVLSAMKLVFAWENLKPPFDAIIAAIKSIFNWSGLSILFANIAAGIRKIFSWNNFKGVFSGVFAGIKSILDKLNPVNAAKKVGGWLGFSQGGFVDGKAHFSGDNAKNDNIPAMLSAGEYVIPRSIAQNKNIMQQILALIENGGMIPAFQGYPTDLNLGKPTKIDMPSKSIEIKVKEEKTINLNVKSDNKVSIDGNEFKNVLLPAIKNSLYKESKRGTIILSSRGLERT